MFLAITVLLKTLCWVIVFVGIGFIAAGHELRDPFLTVWFVTACFVGPGLGVLMGVAAFLSRNVA